MFAVYSSLILAGNENKGMKHFKEYQDRLNVNWIGIHTHRVDAYIHLNTTPRQAFVPSPLNHLGFTLKLLTFSGRFTSLCFTKNRQQMLLQTNVYLIRSLVFKCKLQSLIHLQVLTTFVQLGIIWTRIQHRSV